MPVRYPRELLSLRNFELAWERILRGSNAQYKRFFSHLFPSYQIASRTSLSDLISRIHRGIYVPSNATTVYFPKPTKILRPITFLSLNDQIVYQAIANYVADKFFRILRPNYGAKTFGAQYAGRNSEFFYRPWKKSYRTFNSAIRTAYLKGNVVLADFDLVSFFDLIDHKILRKVLQRRVKSGEVLDLLFDCLEKWTSGNPNIYVRGHGIPQGPEPSAFLAEVFLTDFDKVPYRNVTYLRYVDDIKLLAPNLSPVRRALLRLDLQAKRLGLVPQAQKIEVRTVGDIDSELKTVPSSIAGATSPRSRPRPSKSTVRRLKTLLRNSLEKRKGELIVRNETHFKFALYRLPPLRRALRLIEPLFHSRPDLSGVLAYFASGFANDLKSASILHKALTSDPVFDAAAGDYALAMDRCAPRPEPRKFKRAVSRLMAHSEEKSVLLDIPTKLYLYKRIARTAAVTEIENEASAVTASHLIQILSFDPLHALLSPLDLRSALSKFANSSPDEDLARYCTYLMLSELNLIPRAPRQAGALLVRHLGFPTPPAKFSILPAFFKDFFGVTATLDWERLLGKRAHSEAQRRAIVIRGRWSGNPSVLVTVLDSFNDLLVQRFSLKHRSLKKPFRKAAGKMKVPDYGAWLKQAAVVSILPRACPVLTDCHDLRVRADVAHATHKKSGRFTRPVSYREKDRIARRLTAGYAEFLAEWTRI